MEAKDFKYNNEELKFNFPKDSVACNGCEYSLNDITSNGKVVVKGYTLGKCKKFEEKPNDILFKNAKCEFKK